MNILWDFDGTIIDSYPVYVKSFKSILNSHTEEEIHAQLKISITRAVNHFGLSQEQVDTLLEQEKLLHPGDYRPFEGVEEILQKASCNVIMTHNSISEVDRILTYYDWHRYFSEIVTSEDGFPKKPDPEAYRYLHDKYQLDLAVGDRELDLIPAQELGIKTCSFQNEQALNADYYIESYSELLSLYDTIKTRI